MIKKILLLSLISVPVLASSVVCRETFHDQKLLSHMISMQSGEQLLSLSSGRKMAVIFEKSSLVTTTKKEVFVMVHGVGETAEAHTQLATEMRQKGFDVLRVNLQGHGKTLIEQNKNSEVPYVIPAEDNIADLAEVLQRMGSRDIILAGHSYGGGISLGAVQKLGNSAQNIKKVVLFSSYVKSLDKYYMDSITSGTAPLQAGKLAMKAMGVPAEWVESMLSPMESWVSIWTNWATAWQDHLYRHTPADEVRDAAMKPMLEMFKNISYPISFVLQTPEIKGEENLGLSFELRMKGALAAMRGLDRLNFLDTSGPLDLPKSPEYVLVSSSYDEIVTPTMMNDFKNRLSIQNYKFQSQMLKGGHYTVREKPAEVAALLEALSN